MPHADRRTPRSLDLDAREWDDLARRDAIWAVRSLGRAQSVAEFLASGADEVNGILAGLHEHGVQPARTHRALDFGCGLGRLTRALAEHFDEVIGLDIAEEMVRRAQTLNADRPNCTFRVNPTPRLSAIETGSIDFVLSLIALQHVSDPVEVRGYIQEFTRVVAPGGVIAFQLPTAVALRVRLHPKRLVNRRLRRMRRPPERLLRATASHSMALTALGEHEVRDMLAGGGTTVVTAFPDARTGSALVPSMFYVARA